MITKRISSVLLKNKLGVVNCREFFRNIGDGSFPNPPGLSSKVIKPPQGKIGPGASKEGEYKNPEYFSYHKTSYFEAEIEMAKFRLPQPSPYKKQSSQK